MRDSRKKNWHLSPTPGKRDSMTADKIDKTASDLGPVGIRASAVGAQAIGAMAIGTLALGVVAIGRLAIGRSRIKRLEIDELVVKKIRITDSLETPTQR